MNNIENMNEFDKIRYFMKTLNRNTQMAINTNMNVATLKDAKQIAIRVDSLNNYSSMNKNNDITKKNDTCRKCGLKWQPGHKCNEKSFITSTPQATTSTTQPNQSNSTQIQNQSVNNNKIQYNSNFNNQSRNNFNNQQQTNQHNQSNKNFYSKANNDKKSNEKGFFLNFDESNAEPNIVETSCNEFNAFCTTLESNDTKSYEDINANSENNENLSGTNDFILINSSSTENDSIIELPRPNFA